MLEHILRRMGFGASPEQLAFWADIADRRCDRSSCSTTRTSPTTSTRRSTTRTTSASPPRTAQFSPDTVINDARQRWLFRMIHSQRPLEEKMALFWHNHFATAYSKMAGTFGIAARHQDDGRRSARDRRRRARVRSTCSASSRTGNFRDLLVRGGEGSGDDRLARQPHEHADASPQENFGREIMELFTMGHRQLHRAGCLRRGPRVHGLQHRDCRRSRRARTNSYYRYRLPRRAITTPPPRNSRSRSIRTAAGSSPPVRRRQGEQDGARPHQRAGAHPVDRASGWPRGSTSSSSTTPRNPNPALVNADGAGVSVEQRQHQGRCCSAAVQFGRSS